MSSPYYLRFANESEALAKLQEAGLRRLGSINVAGVVLPQLVNDPGLDLIGDSWRNDAVYDGMTLVTQATKRSGYFANWIGEELPEVLKPYVTYPATPFRVFAGWSPEEIAAREAAKNPPESLP